MLGVLGFHDFAAEPRCSHVHEIGLSLATSASQSCDECLERGDSWVSLRQCMTCGHVACSDESPHRHAERHYHATGHPVARSLEPGEHWFWCYVDQIAFRL
jgi:uncharacterized UBP type Zn finger protein